MPVRRRTFTSLTMGGGAFGQGGLAQRLAAQQTSLADQMAQAASIREFSLHYGQTRALKAIMDGYRTISLFAGSGGGKTWAGPRLFYPLFERPDGLTKTYLWTEPTYKMLRRVMLPVVLPFLNGMGLGTMKYADMLYELRGGGRILFGSVDNPNSLQGAHISGGAWCDEVGLYTEEAYDVIVQRCALYAAPILNTTTPYTLPWVEARLDKPARDPLTAHLFYSLHFPSFWNPAYPLEEYWRLKRIWPNDKFQRLLNGEFVAVAGLCFDSYSDQANLATIHYLGLRHRTGLPHVWFHHPVDCPEGETRELVECWAGQDWGWSPDPGVQLLLGRDAMGRRYVLEEDADTHVQVAEGTERGEDTWINRAVARVRRYPCFTGIWCDPSQPANIAAMVKYGLNALPAINDQSYGFSTVNGHMHNLGGGMGSGLYIAQNKCPNLVRTIGSYVRARRAGTEASYYDRAAPGQDDHTEDALRYALVRDKKAMGRAEPTPIGASIQGVRQSGGSTTGRDPRERGARRGTSRAPRNPNPYRH